LPLETSRGPRVLLLVLVIILAVCVALVIRTDYTQPWRAHQKKFRSIVKSKFGPEKAAQIQVGIQQIWIPDLGVTDRCVTCHMGEPWKGLEDQYIPYASHSRPELISKHPFDKFGCTFCHGGQGYATEQPEAHGWVEDWQDPRTDL
jgi:cytochrome c553